MHVTRVSVTHGTLFPPGMPEDWFSTVQRFTPTWAWSGGGGEPGGGEEEGHSEGPGSQVQVVREDGRDARDQEEGHEEVEEVLGAQAATIDSPDGLGIAPGPSVATFPVPPAGPEP